LNFADFLKTNKPEWFNLDHGHTLIARAIDTAATCKQDALILAPPRCGKSTIFADLLPRWLTSERKDESVIVACGCQDIADYWRRHFDAIASEGAQRRIYFVGAGATLCGRGADVFILDPYTLDNPRLADWYDSTVRTRLNPGGYVLAVDSRSGGKDFASHLMRQGMATTHIMRDMLPTVYDADMNARLSEHPEVLHHFYNQSLGEIPVPTPTYGPPTSKGKCGSLPPNLQAQWFNNVPPEMVGRRTPVLWRCSKGHIWIDTKEARQTLKGFDKCFECQNIVSVSGPNLSKF